MAGRAAVPDPLVPSAFYPREAGDELPKLHLVLELQSSSSGPLPESSTGTRVTTSMARVSSYPLPGVDFFRSPEYCEPRNSTGVVGERCARRFNISTKTEKAIEK